MIPITDITDMPFSKEAQAKLESATKEDILAAIDSVCSSQGFDNDVKEILDEETEKFFAANRKFDLVTWESRVLPALESLQSSPDTSAMPVQSASVSATIFLAGVVVGMVVHAALMR